MISCVYRLSLGGVIQLVYSHEARLLRRSLDEKKERLNILQSRLNQLSFGYSRKKVGTNQTCLIYGQSKRDPGQLQGRTICNRIVNFQSNEHDLVGHFANIYIQEALTNSLRGRLEN